MLFGYRFFEPMMDDDGGGSGAGAPAAGDQGTGTPAGGTEGEGGAPQGGSTIPEGGQSPSPTPQGDKTFTQAQVESMIKARIAEAKKSTETQYGDYEKNKAILNRIAQMSGITTEALEQQLEVIEAEAVAKQTGISPQVYQAVKAQQSQIDKLNQDATNYKLDAQEATLKANPLYKDAFSDEDTRGEIRSFAIKTGVTLEQAFWATQGSKGTEQMERDIEQRILTNIQNKMGKGNILSDGGGAVVDKNFGLSPEEVAFYTAQGEDLEDMAALKNMNNIDQFREHKAKKAKR